MVGRVLVKSLYRGIRIAVSRDPNRCIAGSESLYRRDPNRCIAGSESLYQGIRIGQRDAIGPSMAAELILPQCADNIGGFTTYR